MPRRLRFATGGCVFHVLNRSVGRQTLFEKEGDYFAFAQVLKEAQGHVPMRVLCYCIMPNHWHLVLWPIGDDDLSDYMHWVTMTHTQRWHAFHETVGTGPIYQGRFKSFPVQEDEHFYTVCRYVERNPLRANLVSRAEMWRWSSLWQHHHVTGMVSLADWPLPRSGDWVQYVNQPETERELCALRQSIARGVPFGDSAWNQQTADRLGINLISKRPGRPRKVPM